VPLRTVLETAGILPTPRSVVLYSYDEWVTSIDLSDALHPQTILSTSHWFVRSLWLLATSAVQRRL